MKENIQILPATKPDSETEVLSNLDYTIDSPSAAHIPSPQVGDDYDPRPHEDGARRTIAYLLIGLLWFLVGGILVLLGTGSITVAEIKDFSVVLGPVVTLVSASTGFYYGTKYNSINGK